MDNVVRLGWVTLSIDSPSPHAYFSSKQRREVLETILAEMGANIQLPPLATPRFDVIDVGRGCIKATILISVVIGAGFVLKSPDLREPFLNLLEDVAARYVVFSGGEKTSWGIVTCTTDISLHCHEVQPGDTLSEIVQSWGMVQFSLFQLMRATYESNPHAFIDNDINKLKIGVIIVSPTKKSLKSIPRQG